MQYLYLYRDSSKANQSSDQIRIYSTHLCPRSDSFPSKKIHSPKSRISPFLLSLSLQARNNIGLSRNRKIFSPLPSFRIDREALCRPVDSSPATIIPVLHDRSIIPRFHSPPCLRTGSKESAANGSIRGNTRIRINRHSNKCSAIRATPQSVPQTGIWQRRRSFSTHRNRFDPRFDHPSFVYTAHLPPLVHSFLLHRPNPRCPGYTGVYEGSWNLKGISFFYYYFFWTIFENYFIAHSIVRSPSEW